MYNVASRSMDAPDLGRAHAKTFSADLFCNLATSIFTEAVSPDVLLDREFMDIPQWSPSVHPSVLAKRRVVPGNKILLQLNCLRKVIPAERPAVMRKEYPLKGNICVKMNPAKTSAVPKTSPPQQNNLARPSLVRTGAAPAIPHLKMEMNVGLKNDFWNKQRKIRLAVLGNLRLAVTSLA